MEKWKIVLFIAALCGSLISLRLWTRRRARADLGYLIFFLVNLAFSVAYLLRR